MTAMVETMAYTGEVPWHGLGVKVSNNMTPEQMLKAAGLDWTVSLHPAIRKVNGHYEEVPGRFELRRDSDNAFFDYVGSTWKPVQNIEAFDFFRKFVKAAKMNLETAGALWDGQIVWVLARLNKDFSLGGKGGKEDRMQSYVLLALPHELGKAVLALHTAVRVVCWNTLTMALGGSWKNAAKREGVFRMPHSQKFDENMRRKAEEVLGLAVRQTEDFQESAQLLAKKRAKPDQVEEYFADVMKFDPKKAEKKKSGDVKEPRLIPMFREFLLTAPGQELPTAKGTWWGALNAVTYVVDHEIGRQRDTALKTAWFGGKAALKRRALDLALEKAK